MKRQPPRLGRWCAALALAASVGGCAALTDRNEAIVQVRARQDTAKAARLTLHGVKAMESGDVDRATTKFLAAIDADEAYGPAHSNLGLLHFESGNLYQAVLAFEQASDLMPHDPTVYYNLGLTLESAGKVYEALDLYWQAVEMDPTHPNFLGNLVRLRIRLGEQGPEIESQLQDLVLIETRPDWRRWADRQLALEMNELLDRGPETPDFDTDGERPAKQRDGNVSRVIDLTPKPNGEDSVDRTTPTDPPELLPEPKLSEPKLSEPKLSEPKLSEPSIVPMAPLNGPRVRSKPLPMRDTGSLQRLPPSIDVAP